MKKDIIAGTIFEEIKNFKGELIDIQTDPLSDIPLKTKKVIGEMNLLEKRIYTLAIRKKFEAEDLFFKVCKRRSKSKKLTKNELSETTWIRKSTSKEEDLRTRLMVEFGCIQNITLFIVKMRFCLVKNEFGIALLPGFKVVQYKPQEIQEDYFLMFDQVDLETSYFKSVIGQA